MKNIWIDGFEANVPQRVGSGQVAFNLLQQIEKLDKKNNYTILLASQPLNDMPKERGGFKYKILRINKLKTFLGIPWELVRSKNVPDVVFSPTHYIPRFTKVKRIGMIFDLSYLFFPNFLPKKDLYKLTKWSAYTIKNASHLITISKSAKNDLLKNYKISKDKITIAYPGFEKNQFYPIKDKEKINLVLKKYGIDLPYILYTGTIQPRKNLNRLIESFKKIEGMKLVIGGKYSGKGRQAWMTEEILTAPKKLGIEDKVIFTNFIPAEDLPYLMNGAVAYVLPSLWEGFGIPPLEAMACGTPVIVSNVSSLPEVVGDAGLLVDPYSVDQIEQAIRLISTDKKLHDRLARKSLEQAKKFSWEKMAKTTIKVLENV